MIFKHRRLLTLSVLTVLAVFLASALPAFALSLLVPVAGALSLLLLLLARFRRRLLDFSVALLCVSLALLSSLSVAEKRAALLPLEGEQLLTVTLETVSLADGERTEGEGRLRAGDFTGRVRIVAKGTWSAGDVLYGKATLTPTEEDSYLFSRGFYATVSLTSCRKTGEDVGLIATLGAWRAALAERIGTALPDEEGQLLCALLLGVREGLSPTFSRDMTRIGTVHMLSLSGMHFMILSGAVTVLLSRTGLGRRTRSALLALFALFFMLFTGLCSSVMRACFMFLFSLFPSFFREERDSLSSLTAAVAVICLMEPYAVRDISLWLSVMSSFGILLFFERRRGAQHAQRKTHRVLSYLLFSFSVTLSATVGVLPLTLLCFGELPLLAPVANLLLAPLMQLALYLAVGVAVLGKMPLVVWLSRVVCKPIFAITEFLARIRGTVLPLQNGVIGAVLLTFFLLTLGYYLFCPRRRFRMRVPLSLLLVTLLSVGCVAGYDRMRAEEELSVEILSAAAGDALLFRLAGESLYVPVTDAAALSGERTLFASVGSELDGVLIPFYSEDGPSYLDGLLSSYHVFRLYLPRPATSAQRACYTEMLAIAAAHAVPTVAYGEGDALSFGNAMLSRFSTLPTLHGTQLFFEVQHLGCRLQYYSGGRLGSDMLSALADADILIFGGYGGPPPVKYDRSAFVREETIIHAPSPAAYPFWQAEGVTFRQTAVFTLLPK